MSFPRCPLGMPSPRTPLRSLAAAAALAAAALALAAVPARAVVFSVSGTSAKGTPVAFEAQLTISGSTLSILLANTSPVDSVHADDVLTSFYFDIIKDGLRPTLTYQSASGFVWLVRSDLTDLPYNYTAPSLSLSGTAVYVLASDPPPHVASNLVATGVGDRTWQFRQHPDLNPATMPFNGFGIGTVGNSTFGGNGFDTQIVGPPGPSQIAFGIYKDGNIAPVGNLDNEYLVLNQATFTFTGLDGYTEADIQDGAVFGLGTKPDSFIALPEPGGLALAGMAAVAAAGWIAVRHGRRSVGSRRAGPAFTLVVLAHVAGSTVAYAGAPIPVEFFDFSTSAEGWTSTNVKYNGGSTTNAWTWTPGSWDVTPVSVLSQFNWVGNLLTSPWITVPTDVDAFEITMLHRFNFPLNVSTGGPVTVGQAVFRIENPPNPSTPFQPLATSVFATGPVPPPFDTEVDFGQFVAPNYSVPPALPPLVAGGGAWTGVSPGWAAGELVASRWTIDGGLTAGQRVQLRLIHANLGRDCDGGGWHVESVTVTGLLPEPGGITLAAAGLGIGGAGWSVRRLRARLTSGPRARA